MPDVIRKFFGSEEIADELKILDKELEGAINSVRELKEDWEKKAEHVNTFLKDWTSSSWSIRKLKERIKVVEEMDIDEGEKIVTETKSVLKIRKIIADLLSKTENEFLRKTSGNLEKAQVLRNRLLGLINALFNSESENWRKIEQILQKQIDFINTYSHQDIGIVYHKMPEFVNYLKEEGKLLELEEGAMKQIADAERILESNYFLPRERTLQTRKDELVNKIGNLPPNQVKDISNRRVMLDRYIKFLQNYGFDARKNPKIARLFLNYFNTYDLGSYDFINLFSASDIIRILKENFTFSKEVPRGIEYLYVPVLSIINKFEYIKDHNDIVKILRILRDSTKKVSEIPGSDHLYYNVRKLYDTLRRGLTTTLKLHILYFQLLSAFSNFKSKEEFMMQLERFDDFFESYVFLSSYTTSSKEYFERFSKSILTLGIQNSAYLIWLIKRKSPFGGDYMDDRYKVDLLEDFLKITKNIGIKNVIREMESIEPGKSFCFLVFGKNVSELFIENKISIEKFGHICLMISEIDRDRGGSNYPPSDTFLNGTYNYGIEGLRNFIYYYGADELIRTMLGLFYKKESAYQSSGVIVFKEPNQIKLELIEFLMTMKSLELFCEYLPLDEFRLLFDNFKEEFRALYHKHFVDGTSPAEIVGIKVNSREEVRKFCDILKDIFESCKEYTVNYHINWDVTRRNAAHALSNQKILGIINDLADWEAYANMLKAGEPKTKEFRQYSLHKTPSFVERYVDILSIFIENSNFNSIKELKEKSVFEELVFWLNNGLLTLDDIGLLIPRFANLYNSDKDAFEEFKEYFLKWKNKVNDDYKVKKLFDSINEFKDLWYNNILKLKRITWIVIATANTFDIKLAEALPKFREVYGEDLSKLIELARVFARIMKATEKEKIEVLLKVLPTSKDIISKYELEKFAKIAESVKPENVPIVFSHYLPICRELLEKYGLDDVAFKFIVPLLNAQSITAQFLYEELNNLKRLGSVDSWEDAMVFLYIGEKYPVKALDIYQHILIEGVKQEIISKSIGTESEIIKSFLQNAPAYILDLYKEYKNIWTSNQPNKIAIINNLFKDVFEIKEQLYKGVVAGIKNEKLFFGVLYHVFPPELSVTRSEYERILKGREDRQSDIPKALDKLQYISASVSKGAHVLKSNETLETEAWSDLINAANTEEKMLPAETIGLNLLKDFVDSNITNNRKTHLNQIVLFSKNRGETLPTFSQEHHILMKYKEFIGDRMNDLLFLILSETQTKNPQEYFELSSKVKQAKVDLKGLSKTLANLWNSRIPNREARVRSILERNSLQLEQITWNTPVTPKEVEESLIQNKEGVIEKSLISKIKQALYGEEYSKMQKEMQKFEFRREGRSRLGELNKFIFTLSKRKAHSIAMFNMGVCVAPDDRLWNQPDMWQLVIFDQDKNACGGVIYRTIEEQGKKYLVISIQPNSNILSASSPEGVYSKIMQYSKAMQKLLHYDAVLIPVSATIHSNRGSIQTEISKRNYRKIKLEKNYNFSYSPYGYTYDDFYIV